MTPPSGSDFIHFLEAHGWRLERIKGSHHVLGKPGERAKLTVPIHGNHPLKVGTFRTLLKLAGLSWP